MVAACTVEDTGAGHIVIYSNSNVAEFPIDIGGKPDHSGTKHHGLKFQVLFV